MGKYSNIKHPILILVRGLPGSGKTYLANELENTIGKNMVVMLDPDATDYESKEYLEHTNTLTAEGLDPKIHAYRFLRGKAYEGIMSSKVIIWNQPFTNMGMFTRMITNLRTYATDHDTQLPVLIVEVEVDHNVAKTRIAQRKAAGGHGPSDGLFERYVADYETAAKEGYRTIAVQGHGDVSESVSAILVALQDLR